jgi:hypothetical protein
VKFHIPNNEEVDFACEFVEQFIYLELQILNEKCSKMSNDERLRSLTLIHHIALGCLRMVPRIQSEEVKNLYVEHSIMGFQLHQLHFRVSSVAGLPSLLI